MNVNTAVVNYFFKYVHMGWHDLVERRLFICILRISRSVFNIVDVDDFMFPVEIINSNELIIYKRWFVPKWAFDEVVIEMTAWYRRTMYRQHGYSGPAKVTWKNNG